MADIIIPARGCVYRPRGTRSGNGFYYLDPPLNGSQETPILIDGVDAVDQDIVFPVTTLDEKKYLFVMGEDFGNITISGIILLGRAEGGGRAFRTLASYLASHRVNTSLSPVTLSFPGDVFQRVYLTSLVVGKPDPEFHIQPFQFRAIVAEPKSP
jgi:hypothetical protein